MILLGSLWSWTASDEQRLGKRSYARGLPWHNTLRWALAGHRCLRQDAIKAPESHSAASVLANADGQSNILPRSDIADHCPAANIHACYAMAHVLTAQELQASARSSLAVHVLQVNEQSGCCQDLIEYAGNNPVALGE